MFKKYYIIFVVVFLGLGAAVWVQIKNDFKPDVQLSEMKWRKKTPDLITIRGTKDKAPYSGIVRAGDGLIQTIANGLKVNYHKHDQAFVFGWSLDSSGNYRQNIFFLNKMEAKIIDVPESFGNIEMIKANEELTYVLLKLNRNGEDWWCVTKKNQAKISDCEDLRAIPPISTSEAIIKDAWWKPGAGQLLYIKIVVNDEEKIYSFDIWEDEARLASSEVTKPSPLQHRADSQQSPVSGIWYKQWGIGTMFYYEGGNKKVWRWFPWGTKLYWLADGEHIVVVNKGTGYILDVLTNQLGILDEKIKIDMIETSLTR